MQPTAIPTLNPNYSLEQVDQEAILFNAANDSIFYLNNTGNLIVQLCDGKRSVAALVELLKTAYPETATNIATDVETLLSTLQAEGIVTLKS